MSLKTPAVPRSAGAADTGSSPRHAAGTPRSAHGRPRHVQSSGLSLPHGLVPVLLVGLLLFVAGCGRAGAADDAIREVGGDPAVGRALIRSYGCGGCHHVPGVQSAGGVVGPPLGGIAERVYLAGMLPNNPENMMHWIRFPQQVQPGNAMPDMGVTEEEALHITTYLMTLRGRAGRTF